MFSLESPDVFGVAVAASLCLSKQSGCLWCHPKPLNILLRPISNVILAGGLRSIIGSLDRSLIPIGNNPRPAILTAFKLIIS